MAIQSTHLESLEAVLATAINILKNRTLIRMLKWIEKTVYRNVQQITVPSVGRPVLQK